MRYVHSLVNGNLKKTIDSQVRENPATLEPLQEVALCSQDDVNEAAAAARAAFQVWSQTPASVRSNIMSRIVELIKSNIETLAKINSEETGKPIRESSIVELGGVIRTFDYYAGAATKILGNTQVINENLLSLTLKEPVGVVGQILPWNFPLLLASWKIAPALAAGCSMVIKPSELTPLGTLEIAKLCEEAGVPNGVINICPGLGEVAGAAIVQSPYINKISFTGSTKVGKQILKDSSDNLKKVSLELGGKAPNILFEDCDIDSCLEANLRGGFFNQGENCTAVTRLLVHSKIVDEFIEKYLAKIKMISQGDPMNSKTEIGALISKEHIEKVHKYVKDGISEGAELLIGGEKLNNLAGYFYPPTVLKLKDPENILFKEEIFGPVVAILPFDSEIEVIELANKTHYGLAGGIWTKDISKAIRVAKSIEAGYLWINTYGGIIPETPYGGFKQSGYGKELGHEGLDEYLQIKNISIFTGEQIPKWYGDN